MTAPYNSNAPLFELLRWHLYENGTRPNGAPNKKWTQKEFTEKPGIGERSYTNWKNGKSTRNIETIIGIILGNKPANPAYVDDLRRSVNGPVKSAQINNLPFASLHDGFVGREAFMNTLHAALNKGSAAAITGHAMHGAGGIGKTRLAVEYAWAHRDDYSALLFISAATEQNLLSGLAGLTHELNLPARDKPEQDVQVNATVHWLATNPNWLLVLDNVDDKAASDAVQNFQLKLNQKGKTSGRLLITARWTELSRTITSHTLDVLSPDDGASLLLHITAGKRITEPDDEATAKAMSKEDFDGLALALEQAGAYIAINRISLKAYRKLWTNNRDYVAGWYDENSDSYLHDRNLATTFLTSYNNLRDEARLLLNLLSFLAPDPIPRSLLDHEVAGLSDPNATLAELYSNSLAAAASSSFTVHRCVQDFVQRRLGVQDKATLHTQSLKWIASAYKGDAQDVRTWSTLEPLMPHVLAISVENPSPQNAEKVSTILSRTASVLSAKANYRAAEPLMRRCLAIVEKLLPRNHQSSSFHRNNLALLLKQTNRLAEAEPMMRQALFEDESNLGTFHPHVAARLSNLAALLMASNRFEEAEPMMRRALEIDESHFGPNHQSVAMRLNGLAVLLMNTNRLDAAEPLLRRALCINEQAFGPTHPKVATPLSNLGALLCGMNQVTEGEVLIRRALAIDEQCYGPEHPEVSTDLSQLVPLLQASGRYQEAAPLSKRMVLILLKLSHHIGRNDLNLKKALDIHTALLSAMGRNKVEIAQELKSLCAEANLTPPTSSS